jgi:hypothetical protein
LVSLRGLPPVTASEPRALTDKNAAQMVHILGITHECLRENKFVTKRWVRGGGAVCRPVTRLALDDTRSQQHLLPGPGPLWQPGPRQRLGRRAGRAVWRAGREPAHSRSFLRTARVAPSAAILWEAHGLADGRIARGLQGPAGRAAHGDH